MGLFSNPRAKPCPYEVGDILTTTTKTAPEDRWPGTSWERIQGRMLLAADDTHAAGSTGGTSSITINYADGGFAEIGMVHSNYQYDIGFNSVGDDNGRWFSELWKRSFPDKVSYQSPAATGIEGTPLGGHSSPISILPPYLAVYMWRRTA